MTQMTLRNELAALVSVDRDNKRTEKVTKKNVTSDKNDSEKNIIQDTRDTIYFVSGTRPIVIWALAGGGGARVGRRPLWKMKKKIFAILGAFLLRIFHYGVAFLLLFTP